jgi:hypothetical protein
MLTDPQTITVDAIPFELPRIDGDGTSSIYQSIDEAFKLSVSHQKSNKRIRSVERVDYRVVAPDPLTAVNAYQSVAVYTVIDRPLVGFSVEQIQLLMAGHVARLDDAHVEKLVGQQS